MTVREALELTDLLRIVPGALPALLHGVEGVGLLQPGHHLLLGEGDLLFLVVDLQLVGSRRGIHSAGRGNAVLGALRGGEGRFLRSGKQILPLAPAVGEQGLFPAEIPVPAYVRLLS